MILTFFTSNITKLAHARYLAEGYPVRILGFRQRTYHADYEEPRLRFRGELLDESYKNALTQCRKTGIDPSRHFFFLEDTSVRIEALSTKECDKPGLDIKYWMQEQTFAQLDESLKKAGNNRRVQVRSDVLLHIPNEYKRIWDITDEYLIFTGKQKGHVVRVESTFDTNLVYPWLDNRTFNKWFQPDGVDKPLGALEIQLADRCDFRRKSFERLFRFLESRNLFEKSTTRQTSLGLENKPNLILCGYTCAGKTTAGQHLVRRYGYLHIEASDFMYLSYYQRHGFEGTASINNFAEQALIQKPQIAAEKIVDYIEEDLSASLVISGFRSMDEINWLLNTMSYSGKQFQVVFIESKQEVRFRRLINRMRSGDEIKFDEFKEKDKQQENMGLEGVRKAKESRLWLNAGSLQSYIDLLNSYVELESINDVNLVDNANGFNMNHEIKTLRYKTNVKLEDAILVALLSVWQNDETRLYYTTTEIAGIIKGVFCGIQPKPKHKDNVSRYFNQDFHSYYEIYTDNNTCIRKYRLSNTGYGRALRALKSLVSA